MFASHRSLSHGGHSHGHGHGHGHAGGEAEHKHGDDHKHKHGDEHKHKHKHNGSDVADGGESQKKKVQNEGGGSANLHAVSNLLCSLLFLFTLFSIVVIYLT